MILGATHPDYVARWEAMGDHRWNGAYHYALEIEANIVPRVPTDRPWVLLNVEGRCWDRSIVFVHNNLHPECYGWLSAYEDLVLVCGVPETVPKVAHLGRAVWLPLSVDVPSVEGNRREDRHGTCYAGRPGKPSEDLPGTVERIGGVPREEFLRRLAGFEYAYAVGRAAIEARVLGVEVLPYDPRYPDPERWQVLDNRDAAAMLRETLEEVDG